jgi:2'-phosphotransferase
VLIYLDVAKALADGIPLFESTNGVILSPGNASGCVPALYFSRVVERKTMNIRKME